MASAASPKTMNVDADATARVATVVMASATMRMCGSQYASLSTPPGYCWRANTAPMAVNTAPTDHFVTWKVRMIEETSGLRTSEHRVD